MLNHRFLDKGSAARARGLAKMRDSNARDTLICGEGCIDP